MGQILGALVGSVSLYNMGLMVLLANVDHLRFAGLEIFYFFWVTNENLLIKRNIPMYIGCVLE